MSVLCCALGPPWYGTNTLLSTQGLPFAVAGVGDLLALFRCVSVRYRFCTGAQQRWLQREHRCVLGILDRPDLNLTPRCWPHAPADLMRPTLMGAIGRVYSTLEPEMSHNVQRYDKQIYLRVSEAQRCRVHSTLILPVFACESRSTPLAVFELVQGDRDVTFPVVLSQLTSALRVRRQPASPARS
jgi:hypothetical protein